jgi:hypothetical protein
LKHLDYKKMTNDEIRRARAYLKAGEMSPRTCGICPDYKFMQCRCPHQVGERLPGHECDRKYKLSDYVKVKIEWSA